MGGVIGKIESSNVWVPETILDAKIKEAMQRRETQGSTVRSFNSILLKFPKIDKNLRRCKDTFQEFGRYLNEHPTCERTIYKYFDILTSFVDEDRNGAIDPEELKHCFRKLHIIFTDEEIDELFKACDINEDMVIKFNEFIVLLCIVYLLKDDLAEEKSRIGLPKLEATFETIVDAFVFLDKNKDGYVSRGEMIESVNESGEQSGMIAMKRFDEMDWDHNGAVNFKEFLFAFTSWVGIDDNEDEGDENVEAKPRHP